MTAIEPYHPPNDLVLAPQDVAVRRLAEWAHSAEAAHHIAETLVRSSFVPEAFRGNPGEATAAILAGLEVGLQPMASLRSFDVIQGQAAPRAITLRAIVQSHGHDMILEESTASRCKMRGRRKGTHEWTAVSWTIDRARGLNLLGKDNWKKQPQAMLVARATSELARLIAADAILGIGYTVEEIADGSGAGLEVQAEIETATPEPEQPTSRRMSRKKAEPTEPPIEDAEVVEPDVDKPSSPQTKKAMAAFAEQGMGGDDNRDDRLAATGAFIGRLVGSWSELSKDEASRVIDGLDRLKAGDIEFHIDDDGVWSVSATAYGDDAA